MAKASIVEKRSRTEEKCFRNKSAKEQRLEDAETIIPQRQFEQVTQFFMQSKWTNL